MRCAQLQSLWAQDAAELRRRRPRYAGAAARAAVSRALYQRRPHRRRQGRSAGVDYGGAGTQAWPSNAAGGEGDHRSPVLSLVLESRRAIRRQEAADRAGEESAQRGKVTSPAPRARVHHRDRQGVSRCGKKGKACSPTAACNEGRRDAEALTIYSQRLSQPQAGPPLARDPARKPDANEETDEFAAAVYLDTVQTSDNEPALRLLSEYYIRQGTFSPRRSLTSSSRSTAPGSPRRR